MEQNFDDFQVAYLMKKLRLGLKGVLKLLNCGDERISLNTADVMALRELKNNYEKTRISLINRRSNLYPQLCLELQDMPDLFFALGDPSLMKRRCITIVGTRRVGEYGLNALREIFECDLLKENVALVSGLAYGVDAEVHKIALKLGIPTIAVVAGGLNQGYPNGNWRIYRDIAQRGLILSEFPPDWGIKKGLFPRRNQILAALSEITVVVEAPLHSGALITAHAAAEYGRDVYVIPGPINNSNYAGSFHLLEEGASILWSQKQLLQILKIDPGTQLLSPKEEWLQKYLAKYQGLKISFDILYETGTIDFDLFVRSSGLSREIACNILTKLEIDCILSRNGQGKYVLNR